MDITGINVDRFTVAVQEAGLPIPLGEVELQVKDISEYDSTTGVYFQHQDLQGTMSLAFTQPRNISDKTVITLYVGQNFIEDGGSDIPYVPQPWINYGVTGGIRSLAEININTALLAAFKPTERGQTESPFYLLEESSFKAGDVFSLKFK
jgi:hypothetical protein